MTPQAKAELLRRYRQQYQKGQKRDAYLAYIEPFYRGPGGL